MRFRNTTAYSATVTEAGVTVGPFGEFDWPGYDPEVHGVVPGFEPLDAPAPPQDPPKDPPSGGSDGGDGPPATPPAGAKTKADQGGPAATTPATDAAANKEPQS